MSSGATTRPRSELSFCIANTAHWHQGGRHIRERRHCTDYISRLVLFLSAGAGCDAYSKGASCKQIFVGWLWRPQDNKTIASGDTVGVF